jgi:hypothetical protein
MAESKSLKTAVHEEAKEAEHEAKTGNVSTSKAPPQPKAPVDLPTGERSHPPEGLPR